MEPILRVNNLKKFFTMRRNPLRGGRDYIRAVDGARFEILQGETLGLVGESGSGKSTIGRCILRLTDPTEGTIIFRGQDITTLNRRALRPLRKQMQIVFQDPYSSLNPRLTIGRIIRDGLRMEKQMNRKQRDDRVRYIMEKVGLRPEHYTRYPHEFSGGQRQRIGIARALVLNPDFVVADEPLSALDVSIQAQIVNLLEQLKEEFQLSYLFISHDMSVIEYMSDRIAVMYLGKIVELAPNQSLYNNPKHPYTISLLSAVPLPQIKKKAQRIILKGDIPSPLHRPTGCRFHTRCFRVMKSCSRTEPPWKELGDGHYTACHLY